MKFVRICFLFLLCFFTNVLLSQDPKLDSLMKKLPGTEGAERLQILNQLSRLTYNNNPQASLTYAQEALPIAQQMDDPVEISNVLNEIAIVYFILGNTPQSLDFMEQSIDKIKEAYEKDTTNIDVLYQLAVTSSNTGNVYKNAGKLENGLGILLQATRYTEKLIEKKPENIRYQKFLISCLNNTGSLYMDLKQYQQAESTLTKALDLSREQDNSKGISQCLDNLGLLAIGNNQFQKAIAFFEEAMIINQQLNDSISILGTFNNLGLIYEKKGEYKKAMELYKQSLLISERLHYFLGISTITNNIGKVYIALHQYDSANIYLAYALKIAQQGNLPLCEKDSYNLLTNLYEASGKYVQALAAFKSYTALKDSIFNKEKSKQIAEMEAKYETEKKEKENEILRKDISLRQKTQQLLVVAISALVLVVILLVVLARYNRRMFKQKTVLFQQKQQMHVLEIEKKEVERKYFEDQVFAEKEINRLQYIKLEEQNRKLATSAIQVTVKNQILLSILHEIEQTGNGSVEDSSSRHKTIGQTVRANLNLDRDWEQFKMHFEEVHPGFFTRLRESYPDLTSGEQKICAYYLINLGTNEIAQILNVTTAAVQKSRHRLRKKLGLASETDMAAFMQKF